MKRSKNKRKKLPPAVEGLVLIESQRRCCLCFHLEGKDACNEQGQIAHIDQNRLNHAASNLAYLCIPHHDRYDSITSQSKGLTPAELRHAKSVLIDHLRHKTPQESDAVSLTLTVKMCRVPYSDDEKQHLVTQLIPSLVQSAAMAITHSNDDTISVTVTMTPDLAGKLCADFNEGQMPPQVAAVRLTHPPRPSIVFSKLFAESKCGVSNQQACECIRSHDKVEFYQGERESDASKAEVALYMKTFGSSRNDMYTILVIAAIGKSRQIQVYEALRANHREVPISDGAGPMQALKSFLGVFGVEADIPGLGRSNIFLGKRVEVPLHLKTAEQALDYWYRSLTNEAGKETAHMVSNVYHSQVSSSVFVRLVFIYARNRYLKSLGRPAPEYPGVVEPLY